MVDGALVRGDVEVEGGVVREVGLGAGSGTGVAIPGLVDLQVNGYGGIDLLHATADEVARLGSELARTGVLWYQPTLVTAPAELVRLALASIGEAVGAPGARILGAHLEGPFLSPARAGAHPVEWLRAPDLDVLYVPIGQGSGICGCIMARDLLGLKTEIVGVQSTEAPSYALSFAAGRVVTTETSNTLADGMATRIPDPEALAIIRKGASRIVQVSDDEVAAAIRAYWTDTHNLAEGAGAAPLAAALQEKSRLQGKRVGLVLSGGNIDFDLFRTWVMANAPTARPAVA